MRQKGFARPEVHITSVLRVDLDGDGQEEVLVSATTPHTLSKITRPYYSLVMLRKIIQGTVKNALLEGQFRRQF